MWFYTEGYQINIQFFQFQQKNDQYLNIFQEQIEIFLQK